MDEWLTNLMRDTSSDSTIVKIARAKPADLVESCYTAAGERIIEPDFSGGECNKLYPTFPSPRMVAGVPVTNNILKCQLKPLDFGGISDHIHYRAERAAKNNLSERGLRLDKPGVEQQAAWHMASVLIWAGCSIHSQRRRAEPRTAHIRACSAKTSDSLPKSISGASLRLANSGGDHTRKRGRIRARGPLPQ